MIPKWIILLILSICLRRINAATITGSDIRCTGEDACKDDTIQCNNNQNCSLHCNGKESCQDTVVSCPVNATCTINCGDIEDDCYRMELDASQSLSLALNCSGDNSCQESDITCPINGKCIINCGRANDDCKQMTIDATQSLSLTVNCDPQDPLGAQQCDEMEIYCPQIASATGCTITNLNSVNVEAFVNIYAIGGISDVTIIGNNPKQINISCTADLSSTCTLNSEFNGCSSGDTVCEPSQAPTVSTLNPTSNPTSNPTKIPTADPMTITTTTPSKQATLGPTGQPTTDPIHSVLITADPTSNPTIGPTIIQVSPTTVPTHYPSQIADDDNDGEISDEGKWFFYFSKKVLHIYKIY